MTKAIYLYLILFSAVFVSSRAVAFLSGSEGDSGRRGFLELVREAIDERDVTRLQSLLSRPPPGDPLAEADGRLVYGLFNLFLFEQEASNAQKALDLVRKALQIGANPKKLVPMKMRDGSVVESDQTAVDGILSQWAGLTHEHPDESKEITARASLFFDELFAVGKVNIDDDVTINFGEGFSRKFKFLQYSFVTNSTRDIYKYFLSKKPSLAGLDDAGWNAPMVIAAVGDLEALEIFAESYGTEMTASAFNFRSKQDFLPTVLHAAVTSINSGKTATQALAIIEFLVNHGADPDQRSKHHDLIGETEFWADENPPRAFEFNKLNRYLSARLPGLRIAYRESRSGCGKDLGEQGPKK